MRSFPKKCLLYNHIKVPFMRNYNFTEVSFLFHFIQKVHLLSPKIIYFYSMKNLIHAMRDINITNSLKAFVFYENFTKM